MNDAAYALLFSKAVDELIVLLGITKQFREKEQFTTYTLETHIVYLWEALQGECLSIYAQLLDADEKRLHVFFTMKNSERKKIATSEQMLIGIDEHTGRSAPLPTEVSCYIHLFHTYSQSSPKPKEAGRTIGIRRS